MPDAKRLAVTLINGRSHILRLPEELAAEAAGEALAGLREAREIGWADAEREWLPAERGGVWIRKSAIAEIAIVDYPDDPSTALTLDY